MKDTEELTGTQRKVVVLTPPASLPNTRDTHPSLREERVAAQTIPHYCDKEAGRRGVTYHTPALIEVGTHALGLEQSILHHFCRE